MHSLFLLAFGSLFLAHIRVSAESSEENKDVIKDVDSLHQGLLKSLPIIGDSGDQSDGLLGSELSLGLLGREKPSSRKSSTVKEIIEEDVDDEYYSYDQKLPSTDPEIEEYPRKSRPKGGRKYRQKLKYDDYANSVKDGNEDRKKKSRKWSYTTTWTTTYPTSYTTYSTKYKPTPISRPQSSDQQSLREKPTTMDCLLGIGKLGCV